MDKVFQEWWSHHNYPGILEEYIYQDALVFDIGANIGKMTDAYLALGARVVAVEPQEVCMREELIPRFGNNNRVSLVQGACGAQAGHGILTTYGHGSTISTMVPGHYWEPGGPWANTPHDGSEDVSIFALDDLMVLFGKPDFIKIDVEGYELEVLKGLSVFAPLSFEFHPHWAERARECMEQVLCIDPLVEFNHTSGERLEYASLAWLDCDTLYQDILKLRAQYGSTYFGNIYARKAKE